VFGRRAGVTAALVAVALLTVWIVGSGTHVTVLGWVTRSVTMLVLGDLLGVAVDRLRASEQRLGEAALLARLAWWDWDSGNPEHVVTSAGTVLESSETCVLVTAASAVAAAAPGTTFEHDVATGCGRRWLHVRGEVVAPGRVRGMVQDVTALHEAADVRRDLGVAIARHRDAVEINDSVVQALAVAKWSLEAGNTQRALDAIADALTTAHHLVLDLLGDDVQPADDRLRSQPRSAWNHRPDPSAPSDPDVSALG
jgi:hypothetical protein